MRAFQGIKLAGNRGGFGLATTTLCHNSDMRGRVQIVRIEQAQRHGELVCVEVLRDGINQIDMTLRAVDIAADIE